MTVLSDRALSSGARCLYAIFDDFAGFRGEANPKIETLADRLGYTARQVNRFLKELEGRYLITQRRKQRSANRQLMWRIQETTSASHQEFLKRQKLPLETTSVSFQEPWSLYEPRSLNQCAVCAGSGWTVSPEGRIPCSCQEGQGIRTRLMRVWKARA